MPIYIEDMTTDVQAYEGEMPLSNAQLDKIVELVIERLEEKQKADNLRQQTIRILPGSIPL